MKEDIRMMKSIDEMMKIVKMCRVKKQFFRKFKYEIGVEKYTDAKVHTMTG